MNLDEWEKQCAEELAAAEADLMAAQEKVTELRTIQEGIRLAKQRYGQQADATPAVTQSRTAKATSSSGRRSRRKTVKRVHTGYSDSCYDTLVELGGQSSTTEVLDVLVGRGLDINSEQVRNSFAYLVRKGQVKRVENGVWSLATSADSPTQGVLDDVGPDALAESTM